MSWEFLVTSVLVILIPSTGLQHTINMGQDKGFKGSLAAAFGCSISIIPFAFICVLGLTALFYANETAFKIVRLLGVIYLLILAVQMSLQNKKNITEKIDEQNTSKFELKFIAPNGILTYNLNPMMWLFFLAFSPQFTWGYFSKPLEQFSSQALVFMALTFGIFTILGAMPSLIQKFIISKPKVQIWLQRIFSIVFAIIILKMTIK